MADDALNNYAEATTRYTNFLKVFASAVAEQAGLPEPKFSTPTTNGAPVTTPKRKTTLGNVQTEVTAAFHEINEAHERLKERRGDYTVEGFANEHQRRLTAAGVPAKLTKARAEVDALVDAAHSAAAAKRAEHFPTAADSADRLADEMQVARILARPEFASNDGRKIIAGLDQHLGSEPTTARTMLVEELAARHPEVVNDSLINGLVEAADPDYAALKTQAAVVQSAAHSVRTQLDTCEQMFASPAGTDTTKFMLHDLSNVDVMAAEYKIDAATGEATGD
ncbi:hypothetical protein [Corynebacterium glyciniphilum]|uniref:hypothetical protein n=1 Tax=Corynebacterium glyciniphilum TaxID=1404244 RepID=UPI003DA01A31